MPVAFQTIRILGIDFYNDSLEKALDSITSEGGLVLAPSGPGLSELGKNSHYDSALQNADINLVDSGYLALLWKKRTGLSLRRHSGLKFIKALVEDARFNCEPSQLWVMPSREHSDATHAYLTKCGIQISRDTFYEAPLYDSNQITDPALLQIIGKTRPRFIIISIAGGKQEILGHWLREQLDYRPAIICIGAAIAFLAGKQAHIPDWADRIYIGWLFRIVQNPQTFLPRYWKARKLNKLLAQHGSAAPSIN